MKGTCGIEWLGNFALSGLESYTTDDLGRRFALPQAITFRPVGAFMILRFSEVTNCIEPKGRYVVGIYPKLKAPS